jgi:hypothetical protein
VPRLIELVAVSGLFLALPFLLSGGASLSCEQLVYARGDCVRSFFPYLASSVGSGPSSSWNAGPFTGLPASHTPAGRYYPPTIVAYRLLPPVLAFNLLLMVHHAIAGVGAYVLLRAGGRGFAAAGLGGATFALGGMMCYARAFPNMQHAAAWLPWVFYSLERFRAGRRGGWVATAGTTIGLLGLTGQPQMVAMAGLLWLGYAAYFGMVTPGWRARLRIVGGTLAACLMGAACSLPQFLPLVEVAEWSSYRAMDRAFLADGALRPRHAVQLFAPGFCSADGESNSGLHGPIELIYLGLLPLVLAGIGLAAGRKGQRREWGYWGLVVLWGGLAMFGPATPLFRLLAALPVYNLFHTLVRHVWLVGLGVAWLAAAGWDRLAPASPGAGGPGRSQRLGLAAIGTAGLMGLAVVGWWLISGGSSGGWLPGPRAAVWRFAAIAAAALLAIWSAALADRRRQAVAVLAVAVVVVDLCQFAGPKVTAPGDVAWLLDVARAPAVVRALRERGDGVPPRVLMPSFGVRPDRDLRIDAPPECYAMCWGLSGLSFYSQSQPDVLAKLLHLDEHGQADMERILAENRGLSAVAGKYVVTPGELGAMHGGLIYRVACLDQAAGVGDSAAGTEPAGGRSRRRRRSSGGDSVETAGAGMQMVSLPVSLHAGVNYVVWFEADGDGSAQVRLRPVAGGRDLVTIDRSAGRFAAGPVRVGARVVGPNEGPDTRARLVARATPAVRVSRLEVWRIDPEIAPSATCESTDPRELLARVQSHPEQPYRRIGRFGALALYENRFARDLATLVGQVEPVASSESAVAAMARIEGPPPRAVAYVRSDDPIPALSSQGTGTVRLVSYRPDRIALRTECVADQFLVLAVTRCRGWRATLDGRPAPIQTSDGCLMGIPVPAGTADIVLQFRPILVHIGLGVAAGTFAVAWGLAGIGVWWSSRRLARAGAE